jgi:riboflavin kinase
MISTCVFRSVPSFSTPYPNIRNTKQIKFVSAVSSATPASGQQQQSSQSSSPPSPEVITTTPSRQEHNAVQTEYFTRKLSALQDSITEEVEQQLDRIVQSIPWLGPTTRVLDVGAGDGALIPHIQARGVLDIVAIDVCPAMIDALHKRIPSPASTLGNHPCVRTWVGDVIDLPNYYAPFDAVFFNAVFCNVHDQRQALLRASMLTRPGGWIVVSHPLGRTWLEEYSKENPNIVPHRLPEKHELEKVIYDLPLELMYYRDSFSTFVAKMKVPEGYGYGEQAIHLEGEVIVGFGRGSKQLGVPTANINPGPLQEKLERMPAGVYFGWAKLDAGENAPEVDNQVHKMVMNIGKRPTFENVDADGNQIDPHPETSVEVHIMHEFEAEDFHGKHLRVNVLGFIRPEIKFSGLPELLERINTDIGIAKSQLDTMTWSPFKQDAFLTE